MAIFFQEYIFILKSKFNKENIRNKIIGISGKIMFVIVVKSINFEKEIK